MRPIWIAVPLLVVLTSCSLGGSRSDESGSQHTQRHVVTRTLPDGSAVTDETTDTSSRSTTNREVDVNTEGMERLVAMFSTMAGSTPYGQIAGFVGSAITAATGGYALIKRAEAARNAAEAENHKADADEAWDVVKKKAGA